MPCMKPFGDGLIKLPLFSVIKGLFYLLVRKYIPGYLSSFLVYDFDFHFIRQFGNSFHISSSLSNWLNGQLSYVDIISCAQKEHHRVRNVFWLQ